MGPARNLRTLRIRIGKAERYARTLRVYSSKFNWTARAAQYDADRFAAATASADSVRKHVLAVVAEDADATIRDLLELRRGRMGDGYDSEPILDRHGEEIGQRPAVKASTRVEAGRHVLGLIGLVPPKRVELSGPDGSEIKAAATVAATLDTATLERLRAILPGAVTPTAPAQDTTPLIGPLHSEPEGGDDGQSK